MDEADAINVQLIKTLAERLYRTEGDVILLSLIVKSLIADIATMDRSPQQANKYISDLSNNILDWIDERHKNIANMDDELATSMREMHKRMFSGIEFTEKKS